ncbi:ATP phosphoribosyltransferase [Acrocarpospora catenulata]|uniref:ATP phosphoribosyltransferase n=1 Tax=Acrocarpospora catenulata TaxID=2836182 RepID=UPI001BDA166C|nr:ATP phosphoribosyltransferase [Acrocarpospora catenulata]
MLRVAIPNKGELSGPAVTLLREAGYAQRTGTKELVVADRENGVEFFYLRAADIATYVGSGRVDLGITGRDLLLNSEAAAEEVLPLGFARCAFQLAARPGAVASVHDLTGRVIATGYPGILGKYLADHGVAPRRILRVDGTVEIALHLGVADAVADVIGSPAALADRGLEAVGPAIMTSEAILVRPYSTTPGEGRASRFVRRLRGVLIARDYVLMDYDIRIEDVAHALTLTPGLESPTVSPLHRAGWAAVRAMVPAHQTQTIMDHLKLAGAHAIQTTQIQACRL